MRLGTLFVVICMVIIAVSVGAAAYLAFDFGGSESAIIGLAILTVLSLYHYFSTRSGIRSAVNHQFADLARGDADVARQVGELSRRVAALEHRLDHAVDRARAVTDPIAFEVAELGAQVRQLAGTVAAQQATLDDLAEQAPLDEPEVAREAFPVHPFAGRSVPAPATAPDAPSGSPRAAVTSPPAARAPNAGTVASIRGAAEAGRIELHLQPIVTLPQRKVRYYEAMARLRTERGDLLPAGDFIADAEAGGLMPTIDNLVVSRGIQVVRRLLLKNRDIGLFCNMSRLTLSDPIFPRLVELLDANRAIAPSLVLEFTQAAVRQMGPVEHESLAALAQRGFRFSLDNVADLRIEPRDLAGRNFRFIKVPARLLLDRNVAGAEIQPADLSDLAGRFGIDLIADRIESEGSVVDLLDCDVRYGQGFLFSPPRPVRAEALQGGAGHGEPTGRDSADGPASAMPSGQLARDVLSRG